MSQCHRARQPSVSPRPFIPTVAQLLTARVGLPWEGVSMDCKSYGNSGYGLPEASDAGAHAVTESMLTQHQKLSSLHKAEGCVYVCVNEHVGT